jgi:uncharacterized Zn finger protein
LILESHGVITAPLASRLRITALAWIGDKEGKSQSISIAEARVAKMFELDESTIHDHASPESYRRGEDYYRQGVVLSVVRRGDALQAEVAGSDFAPYRVRITFDGDAITSATCSCPYDWGGW